MPGNIKPEEDPEYYVDLLVDSSARLSSSTSSSNFMVQLPYALHNVMKAELQRLDMLNSFYNVTTANQNIDVNDGTAIFSVAIPVGGYNSTNLMTQIATSLTSGSSTHGALIFTATFSPTTLLVTIAAGGNFTLKWSTGTNTATNMHSVLGFANTDNSGAATYTGTNVLNLFNPSNIYIVSQELGSFHSLTCVSGDSFTFCIPNSVNTGDLIQYTISEEYSQYIKYNNPVSFFNISFVLKGPNNTSISLNGSEWNAVIRFYSDTKLN